MTRKHHSTSHRVSTAAFVAILFALTLSGCENTLVEEVNSVRTETASPRFSLTDDASNPVAINGNIEFPATSVTGTIDIQLTAVNTGKTDLVIDLATTQITMGSATDPETFSIKQPQVLTIPADDFANFTLNFKPTSIGLKTATLTVTTNDTANLKFIFTVSGQSVSTAKDITSFSFKDLTSDVVISETAIAVSVPFGTSINDLTAIFTMTGTGITAQEIPQTSGLSKNNYTLPVEYLVTAANGTTKIYSVTVTVKTKPSKPTISNLEPSNHSIKVSWDTIDGATGYDLYWSKSPSPTIASSTKVAAVTSPFTHLGLENKFPYYYFLIAVGDGIESEQSDTASAVPIQLVLYIMQNASKNSDIGLKAYTINQTDGALTPIPGSLTKAGSNVTTVGATYYESSITVDPFSKYVYITDWMYTSPQTTGLVYTCKVDPDTGALSFPSLYTATTAMSQAGLIVVDPSGKFAYVLNSPGSAAGSVNAYTIHPTTGTLSPISGYTALLTGGTQANGISVDPLGEFVYTVSNNSGGNGTITGFNINSSTGALTETTWGTSETNTAYTYTPGVLYKGSNSIAFSPSGNFYVGEWIYDFVEAYKRPNANGLPVVIDRYDSDNVNSSKIIVDPQGKFLYSYSYTNSAHYIAAFKILTDGTLSAVTGLYNIEQGYFKYPSGFAVDPTGNYLYVVVSEETGADDGVILIYRIDQSTGALTLASIDSTIGNDPSAIATGSLP